MNGNDNFEYTYQSKEKSEAIKIRNKYISEESKLDTLKRLDKAVTRRGKIVAVIVGIIGLLVFGTGMCFATIWNDIVLAIITGTVGAMIMGLAYPVYTLITSSRKKKLAPEIIKLSDEIINESK